MTDTEFNALTTAETNARIAALSPEQLREWSKWESRYLRSGVCTNSTDSRRMALRTVLGIKTTVRVAGVTMTY